MGLKYGGADIKILTHAINLGKGRGLKTGINYYLCHRGGKYAASKGLISIDSDGQHLVKDVMNMDRQLQQSGGFTPPTEKMAALPQYLPTPTAIPMTAVL